MIVVTVSYHLLQHDRHLLLVDQVGCCHHIRLTITIKDGSVHRLDGIAQNTQHLIFIFHAGNHIGRINPGERLIMRVLEQAGRTDGYRALHHIEESHQIVDQAGRQTGTKEVFKDRLIVRITQGDGQQLVRFHKLVEDVGTYHDRLRYVGIEVLRFQFGVTFHHRPHKGQTSTLSSQRTFADTGKVTVFVETVFLVDGYYTGVLHPAVLHDQVENQFTSLIHIFIVAHIHPFQYLCGRKHGTRIEEAREMVARKMVDQRIVGDLEDFLLQILQVFDTHNLFLCLRIKDHEVAEPETLHDLLTEILRVTLRILIDKRSSQLFCIYLIARLGRLQDKRNDQPRLADILPELIPGIRIFHPVVHETHIRNDTEHIIPVLVKNADSFLIITGQLDLWTPTHTQGTLMTVQCFLRKHLALLQHEFI